MRIQVTAAEGRAGRRGSGRFLAPEEPEQVGRTPQGTRASAAHAHAAEARSGAWPLAWPRPGGGSAQAPPPSLPAWRSRTGTRRQLPQVPGPSAGSGGTATGALLLPPPQAQAARPCRPRPSPQAGALIHGGPLRSSDSQAWLPAKACPCPSGCRARAALAPLGEATHRPGPSLRAGPPTLPPQPTPLRPSSAQGGPDCTPVNCRVLRPPSRGPGLSLRSRSPV